jgi:hypothetical protein
MLSKLLIAFLLLALTVLIHAGGLTIVMRRLPLSKVVDDARFGPRTWLLIRLASWVITIHIVEIAMWAFFFWWKKCLPDFESSLYFSVVTYTTVGYGDLVLAQGWRLFAGVEALTGILMCGWSTGFFFIVASKLYGARLQTKQNLK